MSRPVGKGTSGDRPGESEDHSMSGASCCDKGIEASSSEDRILHQPIYSWDRYAVLLRNYVSRNAAGKGRAVLEFVGLTCERIEMCYRNHSSDEEEAVQTGLKEWTATAPATHPPTWNVLLYAMDFARIGHRHIASLKAELLSKTGTPSLQPWPQPGPAKHTEGGRPAALTECQRQEQYLPQFVVHEKELYLKVTEQHLQEGPSSCPSSGAIVENLTSIKERYIPAPYKLIVAVDIGRTYTKVAWSRTKDVVTHLFINGQWGDQRRVPTAILYKPSLHRHPPWEFDSFGYDAIHKHTEEKQSWALFKTFKMELHDRKQDISKDTQVIGISTKGGKPSTVTLPVVRVFCDILLHIKDLILDHISRSHGEDFAKEDIKWVLTVPAMWRASARDVMRQAAKEADVYTIHIPRQLAIASEPESAALHIRSLQARDLLKGKAVNAKRYIVIDIGEGTIDIAVHAVECHEDSGRKYVHELEGCIGSADGATVVDKKFETFLCDLDVPGYPKVFSKMRPNPQVWNKLMANFETSKVKYDGKCEMIIEMPASMIVQYPEKAQQIFKSLVRNKSPQVYFNERSTLLRVSPDICLKWYEPTISSTAELIRKLHAKHKVEALFVVGGFAKCKILSQRLEVEFPTLQLVIPEDPAFAIIQGAVQYGSVKAIESRTSHATYGIKCMRPFRDGDDLNKKTWSKKYKAYYCDDIFHVMVTRKQKLDPGAPYTTTLSPTEVDQTSMCIAIYATDAKDPKYVTDSGCVKIGTFSIKINPLSPGATAKDVDRRVTIMMEFSGPEILVTAVDNTGNYHNEQTIDFLPTCQYDQ